MNVGRISFNPNELDDYSRSLYFDTSSFLGPGIRGRRSAQVQSMGTQAQVEAFWDKYGTFELRPDQKPRHDDYDVWLMLGTSGKTTALACWAIEQAFSYLPGRGAIICPTQAFCDEFMNTLYRRCPDHLKPDYVAARRLLMFPNGEKVSLFNASDPDRVRGMQFRWAVGDDLHLWKDGMLDNLRFCLRSTGDNAPIKLALSASRIQQKTLHGLLSMRTIITSPLIVE